MDLADFGSNGAPGTTRTCDPLIRSQVLYPAELRVREGQFKDSSFKFQVRVLECVGCRVGQLDRIYMIYKNRSQY